MLSFTGIQNNTGVEINFDFEGQQMADGIREFCRETIDDSISDVTLLCHGQISSDIFDDEPNANSRNNQIQAQDTYRFTSFLSTENHPHTRDSSKKPRLNAKSSEEKIHKINQFKNLLKMAKPLTSNESNDGTLNFSFAINPPHSNTNVHLSGYFKRVSL